MKKLLPFVVLIILSLQNFLFAQVSLLNGTLSFNGAVNAQHLVGNTLYVGGAFTGIDAKTGPLVGINMLTGLPAGLALPVIGGTGASVNTICYSATYGYLIGGTFTSVGGQSRIRIARLNPDLTLNAMNISAPGTVNKIVIYNDKAYVFGSFGGLRINLSNNTVDNTWNIQFPAASINDAEINGTTLYVGGSIIASSGPNKAIASYDLANNGLLNTFWNPTIRSSAYPTNPNYASINDLLIVNNIIYFGGSNIYIVGGLTRNNFGAISLSGTVNGLNIGFNGNVSALAYYNGNIFAGGYYTLARSGTNPYLNRVGLAMINIAAGQLSTWNPNPTSDGVNPISVQSLNVAVGSSNYLMVGGNFGGIAGNNTIKRFAGFSLAFTAPVLIPAISPSPNGVPKVFLQSGTNILAGGSFSSILAYSRNRAAAIDISTGLPTAFNPNIQNGEVFAIHASGGNIFIGGSFTLVNYNSKGRFVTVNGLGQINTSIGANFNNTVRCITTAGSVIFVGGDFRSVSSPYFPFTQHFRNFLVKLSYYGPGNYYEINTQFNANLNYSGVGDIRAVNVIKSINGYLYVGGRFTSPRNKIAVLNYANGTGSVVPSFNCPVVNSSDVVEVNDITQINYSQIAIGGNFPYGFGTPVYNPSYTINYASNASTNGGLAVLNATYGNLILRSQTNSWAGSQLPPSAIYKPVTDNAVYFTNRYGLFRTSLLNGQIDNISFFNMYTSSANNPASYINSISSSGNWYFMGGSFYADINYAGTTFNNLAPVYYAPLLAPTITANSLTFSAITTGSMTLNFNAGNGSRRIVLARYGSPVTTNPTDLNSYYASSAYGYGSNIGGAYVVYDGMGTSFNLTNLFANSLFYFRIVEYNGTGAYTAYATNYLSGSASTADYSTPTVSASNVNFSNIGTNSMQVNWTRGNGNQCLVIAKLGSPVNALPANNGYYAPNASLGFGYNFGNGNFSVYTGSGTSVTVSNLISGANYYFAVFEYNTNTGLFRYRTTSPATGNASTIAMAASPTLAASNLTFQNLGSSITKVNWQQTGNGNKRLVIAIPGAITNLNYVNAFDGLPYVANSNFSSYSPNPGSIPIYLNAAYLGSGRVVYNGTANFAIVSGLLANTFYTYVVVEYNELTGIPTSANYLNSPVGFGYNKTDPAIQPPSTNASNITSIESNSALKLSWVSGNGNYRMVVARQAGFVNWSPAVNVNYPANSNFSTATDLGSGNKVVYSGNGNNALITGLNAYTNYYFTIYEFNSVFNNGTSLQEYAYLTLNAATYIAKTVPPNWPRTAGGVDRDAAGGVAVDGSGNVYVAGTFKGNSNWGLTEITGAGNDIFLSKYNSTGDLLWVVSAGSTDDEAASSVAVDASGNPYITGSFRSTATFGSSSVISAGSDDIFIAKYNSSGNLQWVNRIGGTGQDVGNSLTIDATGNILLAGYFNGTISFSGSSTSLTSYGQSDFLVAKYNSSGALQWANKGGSTGYDFAFGVATDLSSNVFVTGEIKGASTFGSVTTTYNAMADIAIVKYNSSGVVQFANAYGSAGDDQGYGIAVDANNQVYIVGAFSNSVTFGTNTLTSGGITDGFIIKITGAAGAVQWAKKQGGLAQDAAGGVGIGTNGDIFVVGSFGGTASFDALSLTSSGNLDIFTAIYTSNGLLNVAIKYGGPLDDAARGIAAITANNSYITGYFNGTANFGGFDVKARIAPSSTGGDWDVFVHNIGATYNTDPSVDLVAWYRFNGNANDFSGNGYNGTIVSPGGANTVTSITDRNTTSGSAYQFNGAGRVDFTIPSNSALNNLSQLTVMGWVNIASFTGTANYVDRALISTDITDGLSFNVSLDKDQGISGFVYDNTGTPIGVAVAPNYTYAPLANWVHVALTYENGVNTKVFYNGNIANTNSAWTNSTFDLSNRRYTIGAQGSTIGSIFTSYYNMNGGIDDVRIYKRALTAVQIQDIMNATSALSSPPREDETGGITLNKKTGVLWPNPGSDLINLEIENEVEGEISFAITDISGKSVYVEPAKWYKNGALVKTFNIAEIQSGYYVLLVTKGGQTSTHKLIISK
ncbi:MAG: LamG-like jellyroll fold domain-containing protein [Bacteroidota bacterium]|nr:LamG-like jellyroll fold domain-containing protein [Bacteroidota bacterium]